MCGVAGFLSQGDVIEKRRLITDMTAALRHRGPDGDGVYVDPHIALGHTRLSIVDLRNGSQPMHYEGPEGRFSIVFNGEIFNHKSLRSDLEREGFQFKTRCDTEVLLILFVRFGASAIERLNGQWACAIWDHDRHRLFLSRDRTGVRPLHYMRKNQQFAFASEVKALFRIPWATRALDMEGLDDILHFWAPLPGKTVFQDIMELPPGHSMWVSAEGEEDIFQYWDISFPDGKAVFTSAEEARSHLEEQLLQAITLRLDADVPVAAYLSGGLDSALVASLAKKVIGHQLETFGIGFQNGSFDETKQQIEVADTIGTKHHVLTCTVDTISHAFSSTVYHTERPLIRTAPVPMFLLSKFVRSAGFKVVLTGEGADEFFGGYDIFRETLIRIFTRRRTDPLISKKLYAHMYSYMPELSSLPHEFLAGFFSKKNIDQSSLLFSHIPRIEMTRRIRGLLRSELRVSEDRAMGRLIKTLPYSYHRMSPLERSQYLEAKILMPGYILSSQGDRMSMAHGVEGRFPFLDRNVIRFATSLPSYFRVLGIKEKWLLKQLGRKFLPASIWSRPKQPFRAPDSDIFRRGALHKGDSLLSVLSPERVKTSELFCPQAIERLRMHAQETPRPLSYRDQMALCFAISTQILHETFLAS